MAHRIEGREHALLDEVARSLRLKNDGALAKALGVSPQLISKVRAGYTERVSADLKIKIMRATGWPLSAIDELYPEANDGDQNRGRRATDRPVQPARRKGAKAAPGDGGNDGKA